MDHHTKLGSNKTGIDMSPILSKKMIEGGEKFSAIDGNGHQDINTNGHANNGSSNIGSNNTGSNNASNNNGYPNLNLMAQFYLDSDEPLGSMPIPGTVKGVVKSTMKMLTGHHPEIFMNKLGERLAFERSGARIYEQLIIKCEHTAAHGMSGVKIPIEKIVEFHNQEAEHFHLLTECIKTLGGDPTAQTPDADASGVAATGLMKVIMDPRTSVSQSLEALLSLELTDNAAWDLLIKLAEDMELTDMAKKFEHAFIQEAVHLKYVQQWYEQSIRSQGRMKLS